MYSNKPRGFIANETKPNDVIHIAYHKPEDYRITVRLAGATTGREPFIIHIVAI